MAKRKLQFLATVDGKHISLSPYNYGIASKGGEGTRWRLDIDIAVDLDLATKIFRLLHSRHNLSWGKKEPLLAALNGLVGGSEKEAGIPGFEQAG